MEDVKNRLKSVIASDKQMIDFEKKYQSQVLIPSKLPPNVTQKFDSFVSIMSSLNTTKDRKSSYSFQSDGRLQATTRRDMIKDSNITRVIVNSIVDDAIKKTVIFDHDKKDEITKKLKELKFKETFRKTLKEGRTHGTAIALYFINDGNPPVAPVDYERIQSVQPTGIILNRSYFSPLAADPLNPLIPIPWTAHREIEFYRVSYLGNVEIYHKSRVLVAQGEYSGEDNLNTNIGSRESVIDLYRKPILLWELVCDSVGTLTDSIIQEIIKIEGLESKLINGQFDEIMNQIIGMMMGKSVVNRLLLDSQDTYEYNSANVSGYRELEAIAKTFLAASTGIPKTKLFGDSPSGSIGSESGNYEEDVWKDKVETFQCDDIEPELDKMLEWIKPLLRIPQEELIPYKFASLYNMSPLEDAQIKKLHMETFTGYTNAGVLDKPTVSLSVFSGEYSPNIQLRTETITRLEKELKEPSKPEIVQLIDNNLDKKVVNNEQK